LTSEVKNAALWLELEVCVLDIELLNKQKAPALTRLKRPTYSPEASELFKDRKVVCEM